MWTIDAISTRSRHTQQPLSITSLCYGTMEPMMEREYVYLFEEIRVIYPIDSTEYDLSKFIDVAEIGWMDGWKVYSLI